MESPLISSIILAGGKSLRLGRDKAFEIFGKTSILERIISTLNGLGGELVLVANSKQDFSRLTGFPGLKVVYDIYPEKGPMGGIYTGLSAVATKYNMVVACDMPFLNIDLIHYMIDIRNSFDVVAPRKGSYFEPLHAVYTKDCAQVIESFLQKGQLQVQQLFNRLKVRYVENNEVERFDPNHLSFFNINTQADLKKAKELIGI